jgi:hypothetical protein
MSVARGGAEVLLVMKAFSFLQEMANNNIAASPVIMVNFII